MVTVKKAKRRNGYNAGNDSHKFALKVFCREGERAQMCFATDKKSYCGTFKVHDIIPNEYCARNKAIVLVLFLFLFLKISRFQGSQKFLVGH